MSGPAFRKSMQALADESHPDHIDAMAAALELDDHWIVDLKEAVVRAAARAFLGNADVSLAVDVSNRARALVCRMVDEICDERGDKGDDEERPEPRLLTDHDSYHFDFFQQTSRA